MRDKERKEQNVILHTRRCNWASIVRFFFPSLSNHRTFASHRVPLFRASAFYMFAFDGVRFTVETKSADSPPVSLSSRRSLSSSSRILSHRGGGDGEVSHRFYIRLFRSFLPVCSLSIFCYISFTRS